VIAFQLKWAGREDFLDVITEEMGTVVNEPEIYPDLVPVLDAWWLLTGGHPPIPIDGALAYRQDMPDLMAMAPDEYLTLLRAADKVAAEFHQGPKKGPQNG